MNGHRWGAEGPPLEAYSRVTNPERFAPLHDIAEETLDRLVSTFRVKRMEGCGLDPELEHRYKLARPTVKLLPQEPLAAPVVVAFSVFPGLHVRFGRWYLTAFPNYGCDACAETAEGEEERLRSLVGNVTAGCFREAICIPAVGDPWIESEFWSELRPILRSGRRSQSRIDPDHAEQLVAESGRSSYNWVQWPKLGPGGD